jgi:predicted permease
MTDLDAEVEFHFAETVEALVAQGWSEAAAKAEAERRFGNRRRYRRDLERIDRTRTRGAFMSLDRLSDTLATDVRHAARHMRRRPAFSAIVILALGLGIGATVSLYSVVNDLLVRSLPYPEEERIHVFWMDQNWRGEEYDFVRERRGIFDDVAAFSTNSAPYHPSTSASGSAELLPFTVSTASLFDVLATPPLLGRAYSVDDDRPGAAPVAVISYDMWQRDLGADPDVVGRSVLIDGDDVRIVGVMPRGFFFPTPQIKAWLPLRLDPSSRVYHDVSYLSLIARARPGAGAALVQSDVPRLARALGERFVYPAAFDKTKNPSTTLVHPYLMGDARQPLLLLLGTVALLLVAACANAAALVLARTTDRSAEFAMRAALGAGRSRLARQIVVESMVLGLCAAITGTAMAIAGYRVLLARLPLRNGFGEATSVGWATFGAALGLGLVVGLAVSLAPVRHLLRGRLDGAVGRERGDAGLHRGTRRVHDAIVVAQVAVAVLLVTGAMLLIRSLGELQSRDPGFDPRHAATLTLEASDKTPDVAMRAFLNEAVRRTGALPGIRAVGLTSRLALRDLGYQGPVTVEGRPDLGGTNRPNALYRTASPGLLDAMGFHLLEGRWIDPTDVATSLPVTVINESFAKRMWPGASAIGKRITTAYSGTPISRVVVGVLREVRFTGLTSAPPFAMFVPLAQHNYTLDAVLVVRSGGDVTSLLPSVRRLVGELDPQVAVTRVETLQQVVDDSLLQSSRLRFFVSLFAALALMLGSVGVYGVVSYAVARRRAEFAIRMALGASPSRVRRAVLEGGFFPVVAGVVLGSALAAGFARMMAGLLFGLSATDPASFAAAAGALLVAGVAAAIAPAIRAGSSNPVEALRAP